MAVKRRPRRKQNRKKKAPTNKSLNKRIKNIEHNMIETKYAHVFVNGTVITAAGIQTFLHPVAQGDTRNGREGNEILASAIHLRLQFRTDIDNTNPSSVRMLLVWDRQPNGAAPTTLGANGILDNTTITNVLLSPHNYDSKDRYKILHDKVYVLTPATEGTVTAGVVVQVGGIDRHVVIWKKLGRNIKWNAANGTISEVVTNSLYAIYLTDLTSNQPVVYAGSCFYYKDG